MCRHGYTTKRALFYSALLFWGTFSGYSGGVTESAATDCDSQQFDEIGIVDKVYDGDTIRLRDARIVRFVGVNTPEMSHDAMPTQALAAEAKTLLMSLLPTGSSVGLQYDRMRQDHYKRTLAHVYSQAGQNISATLIARGYGFAIVIPPNLGHSACYFANEELARREKRGIWAHSAYIPRAVDTLSRHDTGFQHVTGTVTLVGNSKKNVWLDIGKGFSVRISRKHLQYFANVPLEGMKDKQLRLRGWVSFYNNKLRMNIGHPAMMEIVE